MGEAPCNLLFVIGGLITSNRFPSDVGANVARHCPLEFEQFPQFSQDSHHFEAQTYREYLMDSAIGAPKYPSC
jgi:hypothetical protein